MDVYLLSLAAARGRADVDIRRWYPDRPYRKRVGQLTTPPRHQLAGGRLQLVRNSFVTLPPVWGQTGRQALINYHRQRICRLVLTLRFIITNRPINSRKQQEPSGRRDTQLQGTSLQDWLNKSFTGAIYVLQGRSLQYPCNTRVLRNRKENRQSPGKMLIRFQFHVCGVDSG
jgi:hypothetical protein